MRVPLWPPSVPRRGLAYGERSMPRSVQVLRFAADYSESVL
jgi:hypothetical protein